MVRLETVEEIQRHIMQLEEFLRTPNLPYDIAQDARAELSDYKVQLYRMIRGLAS
ncbi:hypothetical protein DNHGIG_14760 [Collibacillus ludicampi]|uniref:Aspartyl-phosphate phosphatase Spo0E family protein n=1 Tax=Collibacillus ludicampi TaxID=2771369 RepID=A0AAV4LEQ9_9BACL|nr:hypothetical protein [Collibacillus ludicampi]GIM45927.1 hypothetical protein DNHGIG_14760 [Collibacillus ludicampi]